jgi:flagellar operon protein
MTIDPHNPALIPPGPAGPSRIPPGQPAPSRSDGAAGDGARFAEVLQRATGGLQFSSHALQRLQRRDIDISGDRMQRLSAGVDRLAAKGARESVVFVDDTAFVVSVRNRTVITAVDRERMRDHVFTNIDSAAIG